MRTPYYLLIVDDETEVHSVTKLALSDYNFEGTPLEILSAYSAEEAKPYLKKYRDIGVILLDVVMETETAGLMLADYIRNELGNKAVRIILRTGQPGHAPEMKVIREYDINDYKSKTELTVQRLFTSVHTALRSYRDIRTLETSKHCLEKIIKVSRRIFEKHLLNEYIYATLENMVSLLALEGSAVVTTETHAINVTSSQLEVISHDPGGSVHNISVENLSATLREMLDKALLEEKNIYHGNSLLIYCKSDLHIVIFLAEGGRPMLEEDISLMEHFAKNIQTALDNITRFENLKKN